VGGKSLGILIVFAAITAGAATSVRLAGGRRAAADEVPDVTAQLRQDLLRELRPVALSNCRLERFGERNDGGYLLCGNLLGAVRSGYSYGISGYDGWGCDISRRLSVTVHQYDCFNLTRPVCQGGDTIFHGECVGAENGLQEGRPFATLATQIDRNGDGRNRIVVKMDVEGAEWDSFNTAPDDVLQRIEQMAVEFHGFDQPRFLAAVRRLKRFFHVAHFHWNNYSCVDGKAPFRAWAYEVLFVNKQIAQPEASRPVVLPHRLDAPNDPTRRECRG
jgi:hypothetical protein